MILTIEKILEHAVKYKEDIAFFLIDLAKIKSETRGEKAIVQRIKLEMEKVGFDKVLIDGMGNVLGYIGHGQHVVAIDANVDTKHGKNVAKDLGTEIELDENGVNIHKAGIASAVYAGKIIKELKLDGDFTFAVVGSVQKEECPGLSWQFIIEEDNLKPNFVVLAEPTDCQICLGHLGRISIRVTDSTGAIEEIINDLTSWNLKKDVVFGLDDIRFSEIRHKESPKVDYVEINIPLRKGELYPVVIKEIENLPSVKEHKAKVTACDYEEIAYTGLVYPSKLVFPSWHLPNDSHLSEVLSSAFRYFYEATPSYKEWHILTNGVSIMGKYNIDCAGFGPGDHKRINNKIKKKDLVEVAALYASLPLIHLKKIKENN